MRFLIGVVLLLFSLASSFAAEKAESFFKKQVDPAWTVHGTSYPVDSDKPPACFANSSLPDGSVVQLTVHPSWFGDKRESHPHGTKLVIRNMKWDILPKAPRKRIAHMNLYNERRTGILEMDAAFEVEDRNTIIIPDLSRGFFETVSKSNTILLTLRDDDASIGLNFLHSREIVKALYDCSWKYEEIYNE
jgi:hypothetical protein